MKHLEFKFNDHLVKFIEDDLFFEFIIFIGVHNNVLFKPFRDAIERLFEAGMMEIIPGHDFGELILNYMEIFNREDHDNIVLTLGHLEAGLWLWLGCVIASIIVFIGELIISIFW